jgi:hypothetical protein
LSFSDPRKFVKSGEGKVLSAVNFNFHHGFPSNSADVTDIRGFFKTEIGGFSNKHFNN